LSIRDNVFNGILQNAHFGTKRKKIHYDGRYCTMVFYTICKVLFAFKQMKECDLLIFLPFIASPGEQKGNIICQKSFQNALNQQ